MTAPSIAGLERALRDALPAAAILPSTEEYAVDGLTPALAAAPSTQDEVAKALVAASEAGAAVSPWGGGSDMHLGTPPKDYDLALDLSRLDRLVEHEPADLTITVEAGMRLSELQRRLGERGQWLPLDPPSDATATIGGLLAVNASGPARYAHGTARDLLIGIAVVTADGRLTRSGGRVVKNVAGYDMGKLHIGALGTLGVVVQASFKVAPLPRVVKTLVLPADGPEPLVDAVAGIRKGGLAVNGMALAKQSEGEWMLAVRLAGRDAAVERSEREVRSLAATVVEAGEDVWTDALSLCRPLSPESVVVRAGARPRDVLYVSRLLSDAAADVLAYPTAGVLFARWPAPDGATDLITRLRQAMSALGGSLVVEAAPTDLKRAVGVWGEPGPDFDLMRRLKSELDPAGTLNRGRFVGGL